MHPHLPRIYEQFEEVGRWYLVMDYIEGQTLEQYLLGRPGRRVPLEEALAIGIQLCAVLDYLHTRQPPIIFRDLKPTNVMRAPDGHLYLIDFGIARHFKPGQAKDTQAMGSPGYAAPEQYGRRQTTPRSDLYSLGATLHRLQSGEDPAEAPFCFSPLPRGTAREASLAQLIERLLEMDEQKRPASAGAVRDELLKLSTLTAQGMPGPTLPFTGAIAPHRASASFTGKAQQVYQGHRGIVFHVAWSPNGGFIASAGEDASVQLWDVSGGDYRTLPHKNAVRMLAWSPDGQLLATACQDGVARVWSVFEGREVLAYAGHSGPVNAVSWSPDGKYLASGSSDRTVHIWGADTGGLVGELRLTTTMTLSWSPDGKYLASGDFDGFVEVWDPGTGRTCYTYRRSNGSRRVEIHALAWSPDAEALAIADSSGCVYRLDLSSGSHSLVCVRPYPLYAVAWMWGGQALACAGQSGEVVVVDIASPDAPVCVHHGAWVRAVAWSPDGSLLATAGDDHVVRLWS
jgi:WD40 repeat protein